MDEGACKDKDPNIFYPPDGHNLLLRPAIEVCNTCSVQLDCLEYALTHNILDGVWGGTGRNQRKRIAKARRALRLAVVEPAQAQ